VRCNVACPGPSFLRAFLTRICLLNSILGQQYLYDEVEAEVNLAFDQLVFNLSEEIFKYYKGVATNFLLDKPLASAYSKIKRGAISSVNSRFETLMAQRHVQILGRSVDLKTLISQHVNG
jgi:cytoplasmic FMR1 interacting protein